jgi:lipoyl synthase
VPDLRTMPANRLPAWFRQEIPDAAAMGRMRSFLRAHGLHTVCESARCPNAGKCWGQGTATFMIMGDTCTRACRFCAVASGRPAPLDVDEPQRVARAVAGLKLQYVVVTSVTRDDLQDGGAGHFAATVGAVKRAAPQVNVELLVPDFLARPGSLAMAATSGADVLGHNIETVRRISPSLRPQADHARSLQVLRLMREAVGNRCLVKSGLMVGLGETDAEVVEALRELKDAGCDVATVGQYLAPASSGGRQRPVARFVPPETFDLYRREGLAMGLKEVFAGPLVRSSFLAERVYRRAMENAGI